MHKFVYIRRNMYVFVQYYIFIDRRYRKCMKLCFVKTRKVYFLAGLTMGFFYSHSMRTFSFQIELFKH